MIYSIIPARGGSKGVPGKNIRLLCGYPLISYSVIASIMSEPIERTIVSTDSAQIAEVARRYGAETPFLRPAELAGDQSADIDFVLHALRWFQENEAVVPEYVAHLRPTTPLRDPEIISNALLQFEAYPRATSLRSAHEAGESPFKWYTMDSAKYFHPLIKEYSTDNTNNPRQGFPIVYIPNGYVDVYKTKFVLESGKLLGDRLLGFISPACTEVDRAEDLEYLEFQLEKKNNPVFEYLRNNFPRED